MGNELKPNTPSVPVMRTEGSAALPKLRGWWGGFDFGLASYQMTALGRLGGKEVVIEDIDSMAVIREIRDLAPDEGVVIEGTAVEIFPQREDTPEA